MGWATDAITVKMRILSSPARGRVTIASSGDCALPATNFKSSTVSNGELSDLMSIPVQCTQELPKYHLEKPQLLTATAHGPAAQCGADRLRRNVGTFSDLLAEDMSKLCVDGPHRRKENQEMVQNIKPLLSLDSLKWQGAPSSVSKNALQADHHSRDRTMYTARTSAPPCLVDDFQGPPYGMMMSDVALQSHVCDFCQAVFPGDTTTKGEFLKHLTTHVT
ncbi:hypothetical protein D9C73_005013 [Collichthys lucidus]|uniref:Uncharacterized protein n=1 Tax=Collichthys lucidus TaxID=240159 RepID=A0A4U5UE45_COLLU|nr:hypothetical protein D9C73_005013 [Collichthys lucidus]